MPLQEDRSEAIRKRARLIWEREGRPDGRAEQHWAQAEHEIGNEEEARMIAVAEDAAKAADVGAGRETSPRAAKKSGPRPDSPLGQRR